MALGLAARPLGLRADGHRAAAPRDHRRRHQRQGIDVRADGIDAAGVRLPPRAVHVAAPRALQRARAHRRRMRERCGCSSTAFNAVEDVRERRRAHVFRVRHAGGALALRAREARRDDPRSRPRRAARRGQHRRRRRRGGHQHRHRPRRLPRADARDHRPREGRRLPRRATGGLRRLRSAARARRRTPTPSARRCCGSDAISAATAKSGQWDSGSRRQAIRAALSRAARRPYQVANAATAHRGARPPPRDASGRSRRDSRTASSKSRCAAGSRCCPAGPR